MITSNGYSTQKLSVRIVKVDYYLAKPFAEFKDACYSGFRSASVSYVPVIRIFGPTSEGVKTCVHLHGVFPYLFIPDWNDEIKEQSLYSLAVSIDQAINASFACSSSKAAHVHRITKVTGRPFYGYHEHKKKFLKIEFYNPGIIKRVAEVLLSGVIFQRSYQPYEAHIPYILQFFIDNNLCGMNFIEFSSFQSRLEHAKCQELCKQTHSDLEVDTSIDFININEINSEGENSRNPGLAFIWEEEKRRRRLQAGDSMITPNDSQIRIQCSNTRTESLYKKKLSEKISQYKLQSNSDFVKVNEDYEHELFGYEENCSNEELNTQGQSLFEMLENLQALNEESRAKLASPTSSPSIVYSDEDENETRNEYTRDLARLSSQPFLKVAGENDSILGNYFSDEELDEQDHLSLSNFNSQVYENVFHSDLIHDDSNRIFQLDGANDANVSSPKRKTKRGRIRKGPDKFADNSYNLRSKQSGTCDTKSNENLSTSPRNVYPQLRIETQKSPSIPIKSTLSHLETTSCSKAGTVHTSRGFDDLCNPRRLSYPCEPRKSDSKRPYPPLEINIEKSPRTGISVREDSIHQRTTRMIKRRRIDFDRETNPDITLMTTHWKQLQKRKSTHSVSKNITEHDDNQSSEDSVADTDIISNCHDLEYNKAQIANDSDGAVYALSNEIGSQKYSLKIRIDSGGSIDNREMLHSLVTRRPVVVLDKMLYTYEKDDDEFAKNVIQKKNYRYSRKKSSEENTISDIRSDEEKVLDKQCDNSREIEMYGKESLIDSTISSAPANDTLLTCADERSRGTSDMILSNDIDMLSVRKCTVDNHSISNCRSPEITYHWMNNKTFTQEITEECSSDFGIPNTTPVVEAENLAFSIGNVCTASNEFEFSSKLFKNTLSNTVDGKIIQPLYSSISDDDFSDEHSENAGKSIKINENVDRSSCLEPEQQIPQENAISNQPATERAKTIDFSQDNEKNDSFLNLNFSPISKYDYLKNDSINARELSKSKSNYSSSSNVWDLIDSVQEDDNEIKSFHPEEVTIFREAIENETTNENSITRESCVENSRHDASHEVSMMKNIQDSEISSPLSCDKSSNEIFSDGTPTNSQDSILHSTPRHITKNRSSSPYCTSTLKNLMQKKILEVDSSKAQNFFKNFQLDKIDEIDEEDEASKISCSKLDEKKEEKNDNRSFDETRSFKFNSGQIDITMANSHGFRMSFENLQNIKTDAQHQFITTMSVEVFAHSRSDLNPDPEFDSVFAIFYSISIDDGESENLKTGIILVQDQTSSFDLSKFICDKVLVSDEKELFDELIELIRKWDPDILTGYEVEMSSWGYLIQRGQFMGRQYDQELSRVKEIKNPTFKDKTVIEDSEYSDTLKLTGRIVLNVWRLMRHEIALQSYTFENIFFHVMHQRIPKYSCRTLIEYWKNTLKRWIVIDYYLLRVEGNILLLHQTDFIGRTSELARLFGIQFYEVLSRGSQYRVESMMLRLAKTRNFVAVSPNVKQRAAMRAPESLPLILEPESKFYKDPVIVLDFQSLYPSIIIAYNYCFSTCLGRVEYLVNKETFKLGCIQHTVPSDLLVQLEPFLNISPCGVAFVNSTIRPGILPSMLQEILDTRLMVKKSMKENKGNKMLHRVLHARQLGLKLIANVTYGYTSANFSGRMPCIEVGDSVVSKGRETLERVIEMVSKNRNWNAKVIYGDTDSIFIMVPNRTKKEAFRIGAEIADKVTSENPKPVKLKFEKVYYPCILQTKKRYVGYMYETVDQTEPVYDAKGIETVRRDTCPAVSKILEKSLKLLFDGKSIDTVKHYVQRQFSKLIDGRLSIQELTFAREYRGMNNYKPSACVPALQLARQAILRDRRSEPRVKERVRYVLTTGPPGVPLIRLVKTPEEFMSTPGSIINSEYYITRAIMPALERCFSLMGVDVRTWYSELPRKCKHQLPTENNTKNRPCQKKIISHYFTTSKCVSCDQISVEGVCKECQNNPQKLALMLGTMINKSQRKFNYIQKICKSCTHNDMIACSSLDCPVLYRYHRNSRDIDQVMYLEKLQQTFLS